MQRYPILLLVSGPPASGKTTLGKRLARDLGMPFISKDALKETLFDTLGTQDKAWARRLGVASIALLYDVAARLLEAGQDLVAESNFLPGLDTPRVRTLAEKYDCRVVEVHCTAPPEVLIARYAARAVSGARHPGHTDMSTGLTEEGQEALRVGAWAPVLGTQAIMLDTRTFSETTYQKLLAQVREQCERQPS